MAKNERLEMDRDPEDEEDGEVVSLAEGGEVEKKPVDSDADNADHGDEDDAHEQDGDARLAHGSDDPDREKFREARRQQRRDRKKHKRIREEQTQQELAQMRVELATLRTQQTQTQQGVHGQTAAMVDQRLADVNAAIRLSEEAMEKAMKEQNGAAFREALNTRDNARNAGQQLLAYKQALANPQQQQQPAAQIDPRMKRHFADFCADNPWFKSDPTSADDESKAVFRLDASVKAAGYDPNTPEYWEELQDRVDRKFPKKIGAGGDDEEEDRRPTNGRRGPAIGGSRSQGRTVGKNEVYVSAEMKKSLQAAGMWDDPKKRASVLKRHRDAIERQKILPR